MVWLGQGVIPAWLVKDEFKSPKLTVALVDGWGGDVLQH